MRRFKSCYPSHCDPLAQVAEHLTFNQGVPSSSLGWVTNQVFQNLRYGEVSERFKELVLKTSDAAMHRGFESHSLRQTAFRIPQEIIFSARRSTQVAEEDGLLNR